MADKRSSGDEQEPTLELPKLFGRRRGRARGEVPSAEHRTGPPTTVGASTGSTIVRGSSISKPSEEPGARKAQRAAPLLPPQPAALVTGLLVGAVGTLLTYGASRGCELLISTGSCGGGPGLLLLVAILAAMVLLGGALLELCAVGDPRSTSFLAVGITAVVVMLSLLDAIFSPWVFVAVPLVTMAAYWVAHWVTTRFEDTDRDVSGLDLS